MSEKHIKSKSSNSSIPDKGVEQFKKETAEKFKRFDAEFPLGSNDPRLEITDLSKRINL